MHRFFLRPLVAVFTLATIIGSMSLPAAAASPAVAGVHEVLVGSGGTHAVLRYDGTTGAFIDTFVAPGSGGLDTPQNLTIGPDGNLYVSGAVSNNVLRYDGRTGAFLDEFVPAGSGGLSNPDQIVFRPDGNLYVSSRFTGQILRYDGSTGAFKDVFAFDDRLFGFVGFAFGPDGNVYATEFNGDHGVLRFDGKTGALLDEFAVSPPEPEFVSAAGIAFGPDGNLYVTGINSGNVERFDGRTGAFLGLFVPPGSGGLNGADYLNFGPDGNLYVASQRTNAVLRYDGRTGAFLDAFVGPGSGGLVTPKGVLFRPAAPSRDTRPPSTTASLSPRPNAAGWNHTDVTVTLTAADEVGGSGTKQVTFSATGAQSIPTTTVAGATAKVPPITAEGTTTLSFFATDQAGNAEAPKALVIKLDKTPPEATVRFDPVHQAVVVLGHDTGSGVSTAPIAPLSVAPAAPRRDGDDEDQAGDHERGEPWRTELRTYRIADAAGNSLQLGVEVRTTPHQVRAAIVSLQYSTAAAVTPPHNQARFTWQLDQAGHLRTVEQILRVGGERDGQAVQAAFRTRDNQTRIEVQTPNRQQKLTRPSLVLLELVTSKGALQLTF